MKPQVSSGVFVLEGDNLRPLEAAHFASEDDFQSLLEKFPALLSGDQINPDAPRRWLLVKREKEIPDAEGGAGRWSLDHLFLDQDGVPTLVEVKRQTDTRIRREVVGQMLDYAANCLVYWPVAGLQADLEETCKRRGMSTINAIAELTGAGISTERFWEMVKTNLDAGRVRLLFVADKIPDELRRVIEFLNTQMDPAEVLGLELRQYAGHKLRTIVPLVVGRSEEAVQKRSGTRRPSKSWNETSFFADIETRKSAAEAETARELVAWMKSNGGTLVFGSGNQDGSISGKFEGDGAFFQPIIIYSYGRLEWWFKYMDCPGFSTKEDKLELLAKINTLKGVSITELHITQRPPVSLSLFPPHSPELHRLIEILDWALQKFRSASSLSQQGQSNGKE